MTADFSIAIHGGAGTIRKETMSREREDAFHEGLRRAVAAGRDVLAGGGSAVDAVTASVMALEDDPLFNAGRGAVFTRDGINELEASVMVSRGRAKRGVGVSGLRRVRNPIVLARAVLERGEGGLVLRVLVLVGVVM
jgi:isoaspartyl peptidase/L-asparaginase-like protein (Ntn-hydrolase superfamily)